MTLCKTKDLFERVVLIRIKPLFSNMVNKTMTYKRFEDLKSRMLPCLHSNSVPPFLSCAPVLKGGTTFK